ncbi:MAG: HD domain-containing protein [Selenomonadaceae bacterium]|nr:HD domain-containing protein [Selenomonadaceae bacterium]
MTELEFAKKIRDAGGTAYLVGGAVRDKFRNVDAHDRDYCVTGIDEKTFTEIFPDADKFGKSFPVYSIEIDDEHCEVAFARTERKISAGYRGFEILFSPNVTIEQDLFRRDTTINAMAIEILSGELIDPFGGREDVLNKKIRAVSEHFTDDPVRALRAARQAAQFNFEISADTIDAMKLCGEEVADEPTERIFDELSTALKTDVPSIFFRSLERADLLAITFPEIANLRGKTQPTEFHPEGDAYEHTLNILDAVAKVNPKPIVRFAALMHDVGKGLTPPEMLPHHYKHEMRGLNVLKKMSQRMVLPSEWKKSAEFVIREHMRAPRLQHAGKIVDLLFSLNLQKISVQDFCDIINADNHGLPPYLEHAQEIISELLKIGGRNAPPELKGVEIGKWIHHERIRRFKKIYSTFKISTEVD